MILQVSENPAVPNPRSEYRHTSLLPRTRCFYCAATWQVELEEAVRKGNEKFNTMITEQLMAQEDIRRAAEAEAKVTTGAL